MDHYHQRIDASFVSVESDTEDGPNPPHTYDDFQRQFPPKDRGAQTRMTEANSIPLSMTPTTQFLDQPPLLDVKKPSKNVSRFGGNGQPEEEEDRLVELTYLTPNSMWTMIASAVGFVVGGICNKYPIDSNLQEWIGLFGRLYMNVMECLSIPLIFTSVVICIAHLVQSRKTRGVILRMLFFFFLFSFLATCMAMAVTYLFTSSYIVQDAPAEETIPAVIKLQCPNNMFLKTNGVCSGEGRENADRFTATNITGLELRVDPKNRKIRSFAFQISFFFSNVFPENITLAFAESHMLGVIIFSMLLGAGVVLSHDGAAGNVNHAFVLLKQIQVVLELILNWVIKWTPLATLSMMAYSIMKGTITQEQFSQVMYMPITLFTTLLVYFFGIGCVGFFFLVRKNPFKFMWYLLPSLLLLFATGSYEATIPVLMRSVEGSKQVSRTLAQFTLSIGVSLSLCGTASFFICSCVFMAYTSGLAEMLTGGRILALILLSTISSFGTPHVSGAALSYVSTLWITVFAVPLPPSFIFLIWMDWLNSRMRRVLNVVMVAFISRIIADQLDETAEDEEDRLGSNIPHVYHVNLRSNAAHAMRPV